MTNIPEPHTQSGTPAPAAGKPLALIACVVALCVCAGGAVLRPDEFWPGYLAAYLFWLGVTVGNLGIRLLHQLTGGHWGRSITRESSAASAQVPLLALLFLPLLLGAAHLYHGSGRSEWNANQVRYLAWNAWLGRAVVYFALWWFAAWMFDLGRLHRRSSVADSGLPRLAAIGLCMYWITVTFAAFDWLMSLEPRWASTIYGAVVGMAFAVSGMSAAILLRCRDLRSGGASGVLAGHWHDVGNMLLALVLMWVYFAFSQFLIIWSGDLPHEIVWYQRRNQGGMQWVTVSLILLHFVVPLALLLSRDVKRSGLRLARVAGLLLLMRVIELAWLIWPAFSGSRSLMLLFQVASLVAIGVMWLWLYDWRHGRQLEAVPDVGTPSPAVGVRDPAFNTPGEVGT